MQRINNINVNTYPKFQNKKCNKPSFGYWHTIATGLSNTLFADEMVGPTVVDLTSMVLPRTIIQAKRNPQAGVETFRREIDGTIRHCLIPGFVAIGVAGLADKLYMTKHSINKWILASSDTVDKLTNVFKRSNGETIADKVFTYNKNIVENLEANAINNTTKVTDKTLVDVAAKKLSEIQLKGSIKVVDGNITRTLKGAKAQAHVEEMLGKHLGMRSAVKSNGIEGSLAKIIDDTCKMSRHIYIPNCEKVVKKEGKLVFDKAIQLFEGAASKLKGLNKVKAIIALGSMAGFGLVSQSLNRKMSEKETGHKGYVASKNFGKESNEKLEKTNKKGLGFKKATGLAILAALYTTFAIKKNGGVKSLLKKLEFTGKLPNMEQCKLLYTTAVAGRIAAASNNDEVRETKTRDLLGFMNFLILGTVVQKAVLKHAGNHSLKASGLSMLNKTSEIAKGKNWFDKGMNWVNKTFLMNFEAKTPKEVTDMLGKTINGKKIGEKSIKLMQKTSNKAGFLSLAYSALALGITVPIYNAITTKKREENREAKLNLSSNDVFQNISSQDKEIFKSFIK